MLGLLALTRSSNLYLPFVFIFAILLMKENFISKTKMIIIIFFTFGITLSPWVLKNYIQLNEFVPTTSRLGNALWLANNDFSDKNNAINKGGYLRGQKFLFEWEKSKSLNPIDRSNYLKNKALQEIKENKIIFTKVIIYRIINFFNPKPNPYRKLYSTDFIMIFFYTPLLLTFFIYIFRGNKKQEHLLILMVIFYSLIIHLPFYGFPRFRFPIDSLIIFLAINYLFDNIKFNKYLEFLFRSKYFRE